MKLRDKHAIGFAEWLNNGRFSQFGDAWSNPRQTKDPLGNWLFYTSKQLLKMYKKEKGL